MNSLYIHIPFCERKCLYCSFVVSIGQKHRVDEYLSSLAREAAAYQGTEVKTVYVGGGTPTFLDNAQLEKLNEIISENFSFNKKIEKTIEANPEGLSEEKAAHLKELGFNRISLGVQSLNDKYLKFLGRCHDKEQARKTFGVLRNAGFDNINVDLMFAFPGETMDELKDDLKAITGFKSEHVSIYALTVEENSRFYAQNMKLDSDDFLGEQYQTVVEAMEANGLAQYEVSNFARPGFESRHNMNYWEGGDYIGLGIGAHSHQSGRRWWNVARLPEYFERVKEKNAMLDEEQLSGQEQFLERIVFGLRTNAGIDLETLQSQYRCRLDEARGNLIRALIEEGLLVQQGPILKTTMKGRLLLDEISSRLL